MLHPLTAASRCSATSVKWLSFPPYGAFFKALATALCLTYKQLNYKAFPQCFAVRTSVAFRLVAARLDTAVNAPRALQLRTIPSELNQIGLAGARLTRV